MPAYYNMEFINGTKVKIEVNPEFDFIGHKKNVTIYNLKAHNINYRIVREGENYFPITADCRDDRINLEIDNNIITKAYYG